MNNKSKRILALTSAAAILATSMPITAFAEVGSNNGLEIGPEIGFAFKCEGKSYAYL